MVPCASRREGHNSRVTHFVSSSHDEDQIAFGSKCHYLYLLGAPSLVNPITGVIAVHSRQACLALLRGIDRRLVTEQPRQHRELILSCERRSPRPPRGLAAGQGPRPRAEIKARTQRARKDTWSIEPSEQRENRARIKPSWEDGGTGSPKWAERADDRLGPTLADGPGRDSQILRKEVIQPQVPLRLPCYDLVPITGFIFGACLSAPTTSDAPRFGGLTGGVYKAQEHIHRGNADPRLLAIPTSCTRIAESNLNWGTVFAICSTSRSCVALSGPL